MTVPRKLARCAVYTRKSTEHNLDLEFNSLDAQREACEAYVKSQADEGWRLLPEHYDDGGLWPVPGFEDTALGVFMEPEVGYGATEVHA